VPQSSREPATAASGSGGSTAAALEREGYETAANATATADGRQGSGPHDFASIRRRIDAHKVYPQIAVRNGWEGRVLVEMRLEGDGRLSAVRLLEGSGHAVLDDATIDAVQRAAPFPPVARVLTVPVEYRLQ
jgi:protein TonB